MCITRSLFFIILSVTTFLNADFTLKNRVNESSEISFANCFFDPLPSWNDGINKQKILEFVKTTTDESSSDFVPPNERIAAFDQDGTLWVSHPIYTQLLYCLDQLSKIAQKDPNIAETEPFKTALSKDLDKIIHLSKEDLYKILTLTLTGMSIEEFQIEVKNWLKSKKHVRWNRHFTELIYYPMIELMHYLRSKGFKTYIVTGGGQDFVRVYSEETYGIPPEQVVGSMVGVSYIQNKNMKPYLEKAPKFLLNNDHAGKPEGIHLVIGRRPYVAFGNSTGDREMLDYTKTGSGKRLSMLLLHDDAKREYAYGPALGLPDTLIGRFTQELYDEALAKDWLIVSMKNDWKRIFSFDECESSQEKSLDRSEISN